MKANKLIRNLFIVAITLIGILAISHQCHSQDKRFATYIYTEPQVYDDSFNFGVGIEYQMTMMYFKAAMFAAPALNKASYLEFNGTLLGFNIHSRNENLRAFCGFKMGFNIRNGKYAYPMAGGEFGADYYFDDFYIGIQSSIDWREDDKYWNANAEGFSKFSTGIKLGYHW